MLIDLDARRRLTIPGNVKKTIAFAADHWVNLARLAIEHHGFFLVALSGGSTPKAIFQMLCQPPYREKIEWNKIHFFWSDERAVPSDHPDSNYHMAMEAGLKEMSIPPKHLHRMVVEKDIDANALAYENTLRSTTQGIPLDLVMLGMGDDGHTASLFPYTEALHAFSRLVVPNYVGTKQTWRMTMTYPYINRAQQIAIYVIGDSKKEILAEVLLGPEDFDRLPAQKIGTTAHRALWIVDEEAGALVQEKIGDRK